MKKAPLSYAIKAALSATLLAGIAVPSLAQVEEQAVANEAAEEEMVEEVYVTGSRIKRSTNTESQSIVTLSAEDMKISGDVSVADALRSSSMNSLGSFRESSGSSAQSNATIDLRGVGASRTLVMINGRRVVGSPSLGGGGTVNLNMIPMSAVDRIEVIADGASAVYGSDAVVGVVNVILKKGYEGAKLNVRYGDRSEDDGVEKSISFLTGATYDRGSVTFGLEYDNRDAIFDKDRSYTKAWKEDLNGDGIITGYTETGGISIYGYTLFNPDWTADTVYDANNPDTWYVTPGANCVDDGSFQGVMDASGVFGPESGFYCGYAYANVSANRASVERLNSWVSGTFELTDSVELYADAIVAQNESFGRYAPPAARGQALASDPNNPYGEAVNGWFRWVDIGTRDNVVNDVMNDINVGARGQLNDSMSWDAYYTFSDYRSTSIGSYYLSYAGFDYNTHNNVTDYDQYVANLKATTLNDDRMNLQKVFAGPQWDLFELPGGTLSTYWAAESFDIKYDALVDAQSEAGLIGGSAGNSATGSRSVDAYSVEAIIPIIDGVEIDAAVRYDDYSDFGSATSPRVGAVVSLIDGLTFKASWGQGFRAPDLSQMYGATAFSASFATDYYGCQLNGVSESDCPERQFDTYTGSNPDLGAETSETVSLGVTWEFVDGWAATVNYFTLDLDDAVDYVNAADMLSVDYYSNGGNPAVQRNALGGVVRIDAGYRNSHVTVNREAVDFELVGSIDTFIGTFGIKSNASYYLNYDYEKTFGTGELDNAVDTLGFPEIRANMMLTYSVGDLSVNFSTDYIGESESDISDEKWDAWHTSNLNVGYDLGSLGAVTVGANNVFNKEPLLNEIGVMVDEYQYDNTGRVIYLEYSIEM